MIPGTIGELHDGGAASPGPVSPAPPGVLPAHHRKMLRTARAAAAIAGLAVIGTYVSIALARLGYPGHLEILEENSLIEVHQILAGQQLYPAPSASFVPDGYPPLYFAVSAGAASVLGQSYLPLRLVSLVASLACFAILGRLVHSETGSRAAGVAAAGLLAATYFATGTWFDVARVDSLFLALSVAGLYAARRARRTGGAVAAGLLLGAAFCTKQTALAEGVAVLAALAAGPRRRLAAVAAAAWAAVVGGSTLGLGLASHGWYVYYVFEQMSQHAFSPSIASQFWISELLPTLGIAICASVLGARRMPLVLLAGCAALAVEAFAARAQTGSNLNDLLPVYMVVAVLAGLAMSGRPALPARSAGRLARFTRPAWLSRFTRRRRGAGGRWIPVAVSGLVVAQIGVLAGGFRLSQAFPSNADRIAGQRLAAAARVLGGIVAIPAAPGIATMAGLPPTEDQIAADDILRASDQSAKTIFLASLARAVAAQRFSGIIIEFRRELGLPADLPRYYHRCPQTPLDGVLSVPFPANAKALPVSVWLPIGHGPSCAVVVRTLES
ncbi:MAG TPA: glycosyltransferase family 39 protein [Trebonia sp.]|nr:glycosyltransferase family 39 protein [Trebonia sp.]